MGHGPPIASFAPLSPLLEQAATMLYESRKIIEEALKVPKANLNIRSRCECSSQDPIFRHHFFSTFMDISVKTLCTGNDLFDL